MYVVKVLIVSIYFTRSKSESPYNSLEGPACSGSCLPFESLSLLFPSFCHPQPQSPPCWLFQEQYQQAPLSRLGSSWKSFLHISVCFTPHLLSFAQWSSSKDSSLNDNSSILQFLEPLIPLPHSTFSFSHIIMSISPTTLPIDHSVNCLSCCRGAGYLMALIDIRRWCLGWINVTWFGERGLCRCD